MGKILDNVEKKTQLHQKLEVFLMHVFNCRETNNEMSHSGLILTSSSDEKPFTFITADEICVYESEIQFFSIFMVWRM